MYILTRYVVWEVLKFFLAALLAITLMFTFGMGIKEGMNRGFPFLVILRTMPFILPEMLGITIPVAMLYAISSVFGRMTGANEIVALKSLGISPMAVVWPVLVLATLLSLGTIWMYEIAATWCRPSVERVGAESIEPIVYGMLQKNHSCDFSQFSITIKRVEARDGRQILMRPTITIKGGGEQPQITIIAAEAELRTDRKAGVLRMICRQGEVEILQRGQGPVRMSFADEQQYAIPITMPAPPAYHRDWVAMRNIPRLVAELQKQLRDAEQRRKVHKNLSEAEAKATDEKIAEYRHLIFRLQTEPYRRWSNGFTCLCFALIGTPVAMLWRHADVLTNFFVCFLPILAAYYPLLMFGEDMTTSGVLPPICFWMGNVAISIPAVLLLRQIVRH